MDLNITSINTSMSLPGVVSFAVLFASISLFCCLPAHLICQYIMSKPVGMLRLADLIYADVTRINATYIIIRCSALLSILLSPNFNISWQLALGFGYASQYISTILKIHLISAGVLQLFKMAGSNTLNDSVSNCCGIDTDAIWKVRIINACLTLVEFSAIRAVKKQPTFYYHLINTPVPEDTWMLSVISTGLLVMAINITLAVEMCKRLLDVILTIKAKNHTQTDKQLVFSIVCFALLLLGNSASFVHFATLRPLTQQELPSFFSFFATYTCYLSAQGILAPTMVILSVPLLRNFSSQLISELKQNASRSFPSFKTKKLNQVGPYELKAVATPSDLQNECIVSSPVTNATF